MNPESPKYKARVPITSLKHHNVLKQTNSVFVNALNKLERDVEASDYGSISCTILAFSCRDQGTSLRIVSILAKMTYLLPHQMLHFDE